MIGDLIHIGSANPRDASWIANHMRDSDHEEIFCQFNASCTELGAALGNEPDAYIAYLRGRPVMLFGVSPMCHVGLSVWAFGTDECKRVIPHVTRYFVQQLMPVKMREGFKWMEARSLATHYDAHEWIVKTGGEHCVMLPDYGKDHEDFILFRWTTSSYYTAAAKRWRKKHG